jgi:hypothetical protein
MSPRDPDSRVSGPRTTDRGPRTKRPLRPTAPSDAGRSAVRRQVTALPAEWAEIDALAHRLKPPGYPENVSQTLRECVRAVLNAEADGLLTIEDGRICLKRRTSST